MRWLAMGAAMAVTPAAAQSIDSMSLTADRSKVVCKRMLEPGSIVRTRKQCFTIAEWDKIAASQRAGSERLIQELTGKTGGR